MSSRRVLRSLIAAVGGSLFLAGCTSAAVQLPTLSELGPYYKMFPNDDTDREALPSEYYTHALPIDIGDLKRQSSVSTAEGRNQVQNELLRRSDQTCSAYQARLIHGYIVGETAIKGSKAVFGIVQTVTAPFEAVSTAFGGISGGISTTLDGDILKWQAFEQANRRIILARRNLHNVIRNAQRLGLDNYTMSQAIYDAERYHSYCNLAVAMVGGDEWIAKEANEQIVPAPAAKEAVGKAATNAPETAKPTGPPEKK